MPRRREATKGERQEITLFHAARSNCSARVRLLLEEKSLRWSSRLISLQRRENRTAEYFAINPKGLVPALTHDGWVITESNDILSYLEECFPEPSFTPIDATAQMSMVAWLSASAELHLPGVKTINYARRRRSEGPVVTQEQHRYRALQTDAELIEFHDKADGDGFSAEDISRAAALVDTALQRIEKLLCRQPWLSGATYSLADIAWVTTIPTLIRSGVDMAPYSYIGDWQRRIMDRPAYGRAVTRWESE